MLRHALVALTFLMAVSCAEVHAAGPAVRTGASQLRRWVAELNDDDYVVRERAAAHLREAGAPAVSPLALAVISDNPEVAWRASEVLRHIALEGDDAMMNHVATVLSEIAKREKPGLAQLANEIRAHHKVYRHNRAVAELRKLGAGVSGFGGDGMVEEGVHLAMVAAEDLVEVEVVEDVGVPDIAEGHVADVHEELEMGPAEPELPDASFEDDSIRLDEEVFAEVPDLRTPSLDDAVEALEIAELEAMEAEIVEAAPAIEMIDEGVAIAAPLFIEGVMPAEGVSSLMSLGREWRGGDDGLKYVKDLTGVTSLQIEHAELTDTALTHIAQMPALQHLQIRGGKFSREALRTFHEKRPKVSIMALGEGMMGVNGPFEAENCRLDTVFPQSAAHDAGLQAGDVITEIEGSAIRDFSELTIAVSTRKPGDPLKVKYQRGEEKRETTVTLKERAPGQ